MSWPASQKALHDCRLRLDDGIVEEAGLFPFFEATGETRALMLVSASSPRILLLDFEPGLFSRRLPWRKRLAARQADLRDGTAEDAERLAGLWHFDPWWELGEERYAGHPAVPVLRSTNLSGYDESITAVWFSPDLGRVAWTGSGHGEESKLRRFRPQHLRGAVRERRSSESAPPAAGAVETGWVLRPWW